MELTKELIELFEEILFELDPYFPNAELYGTPVERHDTYTGNLLFRRTERADHWMVPTGPIWRDDVRNPLRLNRQVFMIRHDGELVRAWVREYVKGGYYRRPQDVYTPSRVVTLEELSQLELMDVIRGFRFWLQHKHM